MSDIHQSAVIAPDAQIGKNVRIGPFCVIGPKVELSDEVHLHSHVTVTGRTRLGPQCEVFGGTILGETPQILGVEEVPESRVDIGARTIIREHVTIHPGEKGLTSVGADCMLMVGVHIAHDCHVSDKCVFANQVTLGGHVHVEEQVWMGGLAAAVQNSRIGQHSFVAGGAMIGGNIIPYGFVLGNRAYLTGLNLVGLRRRGFERQTIHDLRAAYRMLFAKEGSFAERVADTRAAFEGSEEVGHILNFITTYTSPSLCLPE